MIFNECLAMKYRAKINAQNWQLGKLKAFHSTEIKRNCSVAELAGKVCFVAMGCGAW